MPSFDFHQVDVFATRALRGNPLAVVCGADGWPESEMAALARWTRLSETTFLLKPRHPEADYRVRIFSADRELPFAGHPTLGTCAVWLANGGRARTAGVVQECPAGPVVIRRREAGRLAFKAPRLLRGGPVEARLLTRIARGLGVPRQDIVASQWVDNGPGWIGVMLESRAALLALRPDYRRLAGLQLGVIAPWDAADAPLDEEGEAPRFEVRAFMAMGEASEDPVTGSLNASLAQWLTREGRAPSRYVVSQGTVLGREGRVHVDCDGSDVWIGGHVAPRIQGQLTL